MKASAYKPSFIRRIRAKCTYVRTIWNVKEISIIN